MDIILDALNNNVFPVIEETNDFITNENNIIKPKTARILEYERMVDLITNSRLNVIDEETGLENVRPKFDFDACD
jgi:hypothetical protein